MSAAARRRGVAAVGASGFAVAALTLPYAVHRVFLATPIESELGTAQKIFYFHVPLAWLAMLWAVVAGVAAGAWLSRPLAGRLALADTAAELSTLTGLGVLLSGPIWANASWGVPWTGDARQVSTALLWLVFAAYLVIRTYGGSARLAAALAVVGAIQVPLIYYAVKIWRTTHPSTGVVASLPPEMWASLWPCLGGLAALTVGLAALRLEQLTDAVALEAWAAERDLR